MLERQKPFEPVEMVFHEEMDLRDPIATGKHGQQAHGNDFGQIVHRSASGPRILDGFKYHQHAVHLGHHCSSLVTMHLGIRLERAWRLASCPPWVFALSRDEISNEKALGRSGLSISTPAWAGVLSPSSLTARAAAVHPEGHHEGSFRSRGRRPLYPPR